MYFTHLVKLPKHIKFTAIDADGSMWGFEYEPTYRKSMFNNSMCWFVEKGKFEIIGELGFKVSDENAKNSMERF